MILKSLITNGIPHSIIVYQETAIFERIVRRRYDIMVHRIKTPKEILRQFEISGGKYVEAKFHNMREKETDFFRNSLELYKLALSSPDGKVFEFKLAESLYNKKLN